MITHASLYVSKKYSGWMCGAHKLTSRLLYVHEIRENEKNSSIFRRRSRPKQWLKSINNLPKRVSYTFSVTISAFVWCFLANISLLIARLYTRWRRHRVWNFPSCFFKTHPHQVKKSIHVNSRKIVWLFSAKYNYHFDWSSRSFFDSRVFHFFFERMAKISKL